MIVFGIIRLSRVLQRFYELENVHDKILIRLRTIILFITKLSTAMEIMKERLIRNGVKFLMT